MFCIKEKLSTFAAFLQGTKFLNLVCVVFFIATNTALYAAEYRLSIFDGYCATSSVIVPCRTKKDSLSSFMYFNFSFMQGTMENQSSVNNSTATLTPDCESVKSNVLLPRQKLTVSETTYAYLKCLQQLDTLWSCMCEALELNYGWQTTDKIMNDEYYNKSSAICDIINKYMCASIGENVGIRGKITEI